MLAGPDGPAFVSPSKGAAGVLAQLPEKTKTAAILTYKGLQLFYSWKTAFPFFLTPA